LPCRPDHADGAGYRRAAQSKTSTWLKNAGGWMADRPDSAVRPAPLQELAAKVKKVERSSLAWRPVWSRPAVMRALRAVLVIPAVFALTYEGFGNLQIALFPAFGGFASLIVASFGGSRRDKLVAHLGLAVTGSIALIIGTAVSAIEWLAVLVTIPVASIVDAWARRNCRHVVSVCRCGAGGIFRA